MRATSVKMSRRHGWTSQAVTLWPVPSYQLDTSDSRNAYRKNGLIRKLLQPGSVANVAIAALLGDLLTAGRSIVSDHFHERYRQSLVKGSLRSEKSHMRMGHTPPLCQE